MMFFIFSKLLIVGLAIVVVPFASPLSSRQNLALSPSRRDVNSSSYDPAKDPKSCDNIAPNLSSNTTNVWDLLDMNAVLDDLVDYVKRDLYFCPQCRGQEHCNQGDIPKCKKGLASQAVDSKNHFRWDTAMGLYANLTDTVICDHTDTGTCTANTCDNTRNSSEALVLVTSANNLAVFLKISYDALNIAHASVGDVRTNVSQIFAPAPDKSGEKLAMGIFSSVTGSILGAIPGTAGQVAGAAFDVVDSIMSSMQEEKEKEEETPADLGATIESIFTKTLATFDQTSDSIFANVTDPSHPTMIDLMRNGSLSGLDDKTTNSTFRTDLISDFKVAMFQQLAYIAWTQFSKDDTPVFPVITFAPGKCADLDYKSNASVPFPNMGLENMGVDITYNDSCYWLLNIQSDGQSDGQCSSITALKGGTRGELQEQTSILSGLALEDFIIPSVEGWIKNDKLNGFPIGNSGSSILGSARYPGALNITVCDFLHSQEVPGDGCPVMWTPDEQNNGKCPIQAPDTEPLNALIEDPFGTSWQPGKCKVKWWWYNAGGPLTNGMNPFPESYQFQLNINDDDDRVAGNAAKQIYRTTWQVENSKLPYNLYVNLPGVQHDSSEQIRFWYADQFWYSNDTSDEHQCDEGKWDWEARNGTCYFPCPDPGQNAVKQHDMDAHVNIPGGWQQPISFGPAAVHHFDPIREQFHDPDRKMNLDPYPDTDDTWCWVRTTEYWYNKDDGIHAYQMESYVGQGTNRTDVGVNSSLSTDFNAQIPITQGYAEHIYGLRGELRVTFPEDPGATQSNLAAQFDYRNSPNNLLQWNTGTGINDGDRNWFKGCTEEVSWKSGLRQFWCNFKCDGPGGYT